MPLTAWAIKWRSRNALDGEREHLVNVDGRMWLARPRDVKAYPAALFATKREALAYIKERYGYIAVRPDLRREPHGWRSPKPVRVTVQIRESGFP